MRGFLVALALLQTGAQGGSIAGIVMKSSTVVEQTLQNARVELTDGPGTPFVARTDVAGRFVFSNLAAGRYRLFVTKDGSVRKQYGPIVLQRGQQVRDIVFRLDQAPVVSGWVQDAEGEPLAGVSVQALRRTYDSRGNRTFVVAASALTDDRGEYRIFWLDPGEYFFFTGNAGTTAVAPTYYPGVADVSGAKPLRIEIARELNGLNFRLVRAALWPVSGYLTDGVTGRPVAASLTIVASSDNPNPTRYQAQSGRDGTFAISQRIPPGSYIASARTTSRDVSLAFDRISLRPVLGVPRCACPLDSGYDLRLTLVPDVTVNGQLFMDADSPVDLRQMKISVTPAVAEFPAPAPASPRADRQFSIAGVTPGIYHLDVSDLPDDLYLKAARAGTIDVLEKQLAVTRQPPAPALQILLGSDGGRMSVAVVDRENRPVIDAHVVLVPDAARRHRPDQYRVAVTGESARATFRGIPPGEYKVFAWETFEPNAHLNADYLRHFEGLGVPVRITSGDNASLAIRLIPAEF